MQGEKEVIVSTQYLGDSVYVEIENGMVKLTTDNGFGPSNTIYLELFVYDELVRYVETAKAIHEAHVEMDKEKSGQ